MPQIIPIRDLKDTGAISQMCHEATEPIYVTKNGYGDMVIMSLELYERTMFMNDVYNKVEIARQQFAEGKVLDAETALESLNEHKII